MNPFPQSHYPDKKPPTGYIMFVVHGSRVKQGPNLKLFDEGAPFKYDSMTIILLFLKFAVYNILLPDFISQKDFERQLVEDETLRHKLTSLNEQVAT